MTTLGRQTKPERWKMPVAGCRVRLRFAQKPIEVADAGMGDNVRRVGRVREWTAPPCECLECSSSLAAVSDRSRTQLDHGVKHFVMLISCWQKADSKTVKRGEINCNNGLTSTTRWDSICKQRISNCAAT